MDEVLGGPIRASGGISDGTPSRPPIIGCNILSHNARGVPLAVDDSPHGTQLTRNQIKATHLRITDGAPSLDAQGT